METKCQNKQIRHPIRVLHVVGGMNCGGIESWLMHVLRNNDRSRVEHDFLYAQHSEPCYFDSEIERFGSRIFRLRCPHWNILKLGQSLRQIMTENGPYDVVHSHTGWFSGFGMKYAAACGVPVRIAHLHSILPPSPKTVTGTARRFYVKLMKRFMHRYVTHGIVCSNDAGKVLGDAWGQDPRWRVVFCGVDLKRFSDPIDKSQVRRELGIPENALVVGHIGRFDIRKNHDFIIDVMNELVQIEKNSILLLVGTGDLKPAIEEKIDQLGLKTNVIFAGVRSDIPRLLRGAMDCFLFPSLCEGMGLVGIEAQAAGIPCIISDHLPLATEGNIVPDLIHGLPLSSPAKEWAKKICEVKEHDSHCSPVDALHRVTQSKFNIESSLNTLMDLYSGSSNRSCTADKPCCLV